ncbi:MAG: GTP-binding protein [Thermoplasmatota archaeon]
MEFGVPVLDERLTGAPVLLRGLPGVDPAPFVDQVIRREGKPIVYLTLEKPPQRIRDRLAAKGINAPLHFIDGHHPRIGMPPDGMPIDIHNPLSLIQALDEAAQKHPDAFLVLDDLGSMAMMEPARLASAWQRLVASAHRLHGPLAVYTQWDTPPVDLDAFGDEVRLLGIQERIITHEYFRVRPQDGDQQAPVMYRADIHGVRAYIPKLVVTGPGDAGKSTFIRSLCPKAVSAERNGTTVAGDRGTTTIRGVEVELFGTPGQKRFDKLLPTLIGQAMGVLFLVDASDRDDFQRAAQMLQLVRKTGRHIVVVANKMDRDGATEPERLAAALDLTDDTPVVACTATDPDAARQALDAMIDDLLQAVPA